MDWISVDDRLPEDDAEVLVVGPSGLLFLAEHDAGVWLDDDGRWLNVTHWMPLPDPPEGYASKPSTSDREYPDAPCPRCGSALMTNGTILWCSNTGGPGRASCRYGLDERAVVPKEG